jgi:hypothetical protein
MSRWPARAVPPRRRRAPAFSNQFGGTFAEDAEDYATADIMNGRIDAHDKAAWMLRSHLVNE